MLEILKGEFFWGIVIGLSLSLVGGWVLAHLTVKLQQENQKRLIKRLCRDTAKNIKKISEEFDDVRNRTKLIYSDYLNLIDIEVSVFGRNREHLVLLTEVDAEEVRKYFTDIATRRAEVLTKLHEFSQFYDESVQITAAGRAPEAQRLKDQADEKLGEAKTAADRLVEKAKSADGLIVRLSHQK